MAKCLTARAPLIALMLGMSTTCHSGSNSGTDYSNFGLELITPIFPNRNSLAIYKNRDDVKPAVILNHVPVINLYNNWKPCIRNDSPQGWVRCTLDTTEGWVKRSSFRGPQDMTPVAQWAFRYWLYVASDSTGGEETLMMYKVVPRSPYLIKPKQFDNIFFLVHFDRQGFAISPKTKRKTGDRVFMVGNAVYLAPANPQKRLRTPWLFLNYYNARLNALCPGESNDSCHSAVNLHPLWPGIKALHTTPPHPSDRDDAKSGELDTRWYGPRKVAFARHDDPVTPFIYKVPINVHMAIDGYSTTAEQLEKNRVQPFCLIDCTKGLNPITLELKPGDL